MSDTFFRPDATDVDWAVTDYKGAETRCAFYKIPVSRGYEGSNDGSALFGHNRGFFVSYLGVAGA